MMNGDTRRYLTRDEQRMLAAALRRSARTINEGGQDAATRKDADGPSPELVPHPVPPSPTDVRRFSCHTQEDGVYESRTGEHVAYADYAKLAAALTAIRTERDALSRNNDTLIRLVGKIGAERDALQAQLREIARLWDIPPEEMPDDWREQWLAAIDAARGKV